MGTTLPRMANTPERLPVEIRVAKKDKAGGNLSRKSSRLFIVDNLGIIVCSKWRFGFRKNMRRNRKRLARRRQVAA